MYDGGEHNPKLMPCSHTVCIQCLDRIVATFARDTGQFRCPICRELITIPRGGVQALPPSFLVNQLLDLMARQRREVIPKCSTHHNQVSSSYELYGEFSIREIKYMMIQVLILLLNIHIFYRNYYFVRHVIQCFVHYVPEEPMNHHQIVIKRESYPKTHQHHQESQIHQLYPASKKV